MYHYTNLSAALRDQQSPLRRYLQDRFPSTRALQTGFRQRRGDLLVDGGTADPAVLGAAFDLAVRYRVAPEHRPTVALIGFTQRTRELAVVDRVAHVARDAAHRGEPGRDLLDRACWALALCTDVYRRGLVLGVGVAPLIAAGRFTPDELLAAAPADALRQLRDLGEVAAHALLPHLHPPVHVGPTFDGSTLCNADADLVCDGLLVDIKVRLGVRRRRTGQRSDSLARLDLLQLLGYVLFDRSDHYRIRAIGLYSARYGTLATWPLQEVLRVLAGEDVDLARERARVWQLLGGT